MLEGEECMGGGCVNGARFGILYYKLIVDKRCGIQKICWLGDGYI
jgi:hypothetical protein